MKTFRFRLAPVHQVRSQEQDEKREALRRCLEEERRIQAELQRLVEEEQELQRQWREQDRRNVDMGLVWKQCFDCLCSLRARKQEVLARLQQAEAKRAEAFAAWREAASAVRSLDRLRQRQWQFWKREQQSREQRELDEWSVLFDGRRRKEATR